MQPIHQIAMESLRLLFEKVFEYFGAPFRSWQSVWSAVSAAPRAFLDLNSKTAWPYFVSSLLVAWIIFLRTRKIHGCKSFFAFMFPRDIYQHRSAVADYKFVAFELSTRLLFTAPFISAVSYAIYKGLHLVLPSVPGVWIANPLARGIAVSIAGVVVMDFGFFVSHYLMHRLPTLWQFHELHHSAEVLTPITVYRVHPVEELVSGLVGAMVGAIVGVLYGSAFRRETDILTIFGVNVIILGFFLFGNTLRHSHIWLSYGPVMSRLFISPAQHQIHHSMDPKHWNKNFGYIFAFWDLFSKTLYVPGRQETLEFGVPGYDAADFSTLPRMYLLPFKKAGNVLATRVGSLRHTLQRYMKQDSRLQDSEREAVGRSD
jgi:sterol desaturase/sphingolipid hydroxylase (fatty acid hydroxylase superfamily)